MEWEKPGRESSRAIVDGIPDRWTRVCIAAMHLRTQLITYVTQSYGEILAVFPERISKPSKPRGIAKDGGKV
jgi:hypothetical protein